MDMEFIQFHPTGMVWPPSVRGILVTEGVRGDGGTLKNTEGKRFMFNYIPEFFKAETADTERRSGAWYEDKRTTAARRTCCRATRSPGRSTPRSKPAAAAPRRRLPRHRVAPPRRLHPASGCRPCTTSSRNWRMSTSPKSRWRSARPATTPWAASASTPTPRRPRCPVSSPPAKSPPDAWRQSPGRQLALRPRWSSAGAPGSTPPSTRRG